MRLNLEIKFIEKFFPPSSKFKLNEILALSHHIIYLTNSLSLFHNHPPYIIIINHIIVQYTTLTTSNADAIVTSVLCTLISTRVYTTHREPSIYITSNPHVVAVILYSVHITVQLI